MVVRHVEAHRPHRRERIRRPDKLVLDGPDPSDFILPSPRPEDLHHRVRADLHHGRPIERRAVRDEEEGERLWVGRVLPDPHAVRPDAVCFLREAGDLEHAMLVRRGEREECDAVGGDVRKRGSVVSVHGGYPEVPDVNV